MARRLSPGSGPALTRRHFLLLSATSLTGALVAACGGSVATPTSAPQPTAAPPVSSTAPQPSAIASAAPSAAPAASVAPAASAAAQASAAPAASAAPPPPVAAPAAFKESPLLADLVRQGRLPAAAERLPKNPLVVQPVERVGKYGGTWRTGILGPANSAVLTQTIGYEHLVRWDPAWQRPIPNVAASVATNPDFTAYTFTLRDGLKWSDGKPFTADDILFWWEDIVNNKELSPGGASAWMKSGGKVGTVERVDALTVRFGFPSPNGLFLTNLANSNTGVEPTRYPRHYLQQFHQKYNTTNLDQLIREAGAESWVRLFQTKGAGVPGTPTDARWQNLDLPTLHGWRITAPLGVGTRVAAERNPFYFKVDPEGNQLPYIDRVTYDVIPETETLVLKMLGGEHDTVHPTVTTAANKAVFADGQGRGNYRFIELPPSGSNECALALNLTHKDPIKRQVFQNRDFRAGLSHAINRQEIIDIVFVGQGEPWQVAPRREAPWFSERLAKQYVEYDAKKANEFLDKALPQKDGQGFRLGPDGKRFSFQVEVMSNRLQRVDTMNLIQRYWQAVGVDMQVKPEEVALFDSRREANEHDAMINAGQGGLRNALTEMPWFLPFNQFSAFAIPWYQWFNPPSNPRAQTEEPPAPVKRQMEIYRQIETTGDPARQIELMKQLLTIAEEQFYAIGILQPGSGYSLARNNLRNIPATIFDGGGSYPHPAPTNPSQFFFE